MYLQWHSQCPPFAGCFLPDLFSAGCFPAKMFSFWNAFPHQLSCRILPPNIFSAGSSPLYFSVQDSSPLYFLCRMLPPYYFLCRMLSHHAADVTVLVIVLLAFLCNSPRFFELETVAFNKTLCGKNNNIAFLIGV